MFVLRSSLPLLLNRARRCSFPPMETTSIIQPSYQFLRQTKSLASSCSTSPSLSSIKKNVAPAQAVVDAVAVVKLPLKSLVAVLDALKVSILVSYVIVSHTRSQQKKKARPNGSELSSIRKPTNTICIYRSDPRRKSPP